MPLCISRTHEEDLVGEAVVAALRQGMDAHGQVTLLVPSFLLALEAQRALAEVPGLSLGVTVTTPLAWAKERWEVWGDGTHVIEPTARLVLVTEVLRRYEEEPWGPAVSPGSVSLLSQLVQSLPWLPIDVAGQVEPGACAAAGLTEAETGMVRAAAAYAHEVASRGLVEECQVMERLPGLLGASGVAAGAFVAAGFSRLSRRERELLLGLADVGEVTLVVPSGDGVALRCVGEMLSQLRREAEGCGVSTAERSCPAAGKPVGGSRAPELARLRSSLFEPACDGTLEPTGAVRLLEPSGPLAEAELVAREVEDLSAQGARRVVVACPDVRRAWRELVPKLLARGVAVRAQLDVPVTELEAGRAFFEYAESVATLAELDAAWPAPEQTPDGVVVNLGDMTWWPPEPLVDFLRSEISHVGTEKATRLDATWRGDRLLTPGDVLAALQNPRQTSAPVAQATRELLLGRLGSAASKLLAPYVTESAAGEGEAGHELEKSSAMDALAAVLNVAGTLKELGISAARDAEAPVSLAALVQTARLGLAQTAAVLRSSAGPSGAACTVEVLSPSRAATLPPASRDALICCGLTAAESPLPSSDDALSAMLVALGVEPAADGLARERWSFRCLCSVPCSRLVLERALFDASSKDAYPAVVLSELMACYGERSGGLPRRGRGEDAAAENVSARGSRPQKVGEEVPAEAGRIDDGLRRFVVVPPSGELELPDGRPKLSASQIESYLECPLKWFSLRRLHLQDSDAGHTPLEMGTFAHRVLEVTHRRMLARALEQMGVAEEEASALLADPSRHVPGSSVDVSTLPVAHQILEEEFWEHRRHMYLRTGKNKTAYQALIAHDATDVGREEQLRRDLLSTLDYESARFVGFEPRLFEWEFGKHGEQVEYAGAYLTGTVDRVDVDAHGQAVVIDYKHKGPAGFFGEYAAFTKDGREVGSALALPRRVQTLIYAQIVRRRYPGLNVVAAVYLGTRGAHELSGAICTNVLDRVLGKLPRDERAARLGVSELDGFGMADERGMSALLEAAEEQIASAVERMRAGYIDADPKDDEACAYCPVLNCQKRRSK